MILGVDGNPVPKQIPCGNCVALEKPSAGCDNCRGKGTICDHGIRFDKDEAMKLLEEGAKRPLVQDPALAFILGNSAAETIRKRWPRGWFTAKSPCSGCGYVGIAYASYEHFTYGDW